MTDPAADPAPGPSPTTGDEPPRPRPAAAYHFDGGCRPNPGPIEVAVVSGGDCLIRDHLGPGDNNEAEWLALLFAVELAAAAGVADALFVGDSALVIGQARGRRPCRSPHLQPYLARFRVAAAGFGRIRLRQVPRSKNLAGIALARRHPR